MQSGKCLNPIFCISYRRCNLMAQSCCALKSRGLFFLTPDHIVHDSALADTKRCSSDLASSQWTGKFSLRRTWVLYSIFRTKTRINWADKRNHNGILLPVTYSSSKVVVQFWWHLGNRRIGTRFVCISELMHLAKTIYRAILPTSVMPPHQGSFKGLLWLCAHFKMIVVCLGITWMRMISVNVKIAFM